MLISVRGHRDAGVMCLICLWLYKLSGRRSLSFQSPYPSFLLVLPSVPEAHVVLSALDAVRRQTQEKSCCCSCGEGVQPVLEGTCSPSLPIFLYWNRQWHQWSYLPCPLCVLSCSPCPLPCCSTSVCAVVRWKGWGDGLVRKWAAFP